MLSTFPCYILTYNIPFATCIASLTRLFPYKFICQSSCQNCVAKCHFLFMLSCHIQHQYIGKMLLKHFVILASVKDPALRKIQPKKKIKRIKSNQENQENNYSLDFFGWILLELDP